MVHGGGTALVAGAATGWAAALARDLGDRGWRVETDPRTDARFGLLVWSAPLPAADEAASTDEAAWRATAEACLDLPLRLARRLAEGRGPEGRGQAILLLDPSAWDLRPGRFSHAVGHMALWCLGRGLARSLAPAVRVNALGVPLDRTSPGAAISPEDEGKARRALRFLMDAPAVTGQFISIDGGEHWTAPPFSS
jgi:NAD(P)-dependent dehydrogenase (short-subunit alcohol dehydrogenase family)